MIKRTLTVKNVAQRFIIIRQILSSSQHTEHTRLNNKLLAKTSCVCQHNGLPNICLVEIVV
jgi:hypothetical protein